ncbi:MAG: hypothetical protein KatS3mg119_1973 [Rhodothalassiaceae bacterium]|nr:MAG: hypothetical protein KatS3mg119_1973 [Rhodothalassiaceae bacterium]
MAAVDTTRLLSGEPHSLLIDPLRGIAEKPAPSERVIDPSCVDFAASGEGLRVWLRRTGLARSALADPDDRRFAEREAERFWQSALSVAWPRAFWVNGPRVAREAERKARQLRAAADMGWKIPRTLMSNEPERIRAFVSTLGGRAVYKPFGPFNWEEQDARLAVHAEVVTTDFLGDSAMLEAAPGIYQEVIEKVADVRVVVFGHCVVAAEVSAELPAGAIDWKRVHPSWLTVAPVNLPAPVEDAVRRLMDSLDLRFGCLDLVRTAEGEWVFLEVNEAGQFLWLEEACPELPMLAHFCGLLWEADAGFSGATQAFRRSLRLERFLKPKREEAPA